MNRTTTSLVLARFRPDRPKGGGALRNWQNIRALGVLGDVDVVSVGGEEDVGPVPGVRDWTHFALPRLREGRGLPRRLLAKLWRFRSGVHPMIEDHRRPEVVRWLRSRLSEHRYDVAVIEEVWLARFLDDLRRGSRSVIFDATNVEGALRADELRAQRSLGGSGMSPQIEALLSRRLLEAERRVIRDSDRVWACSQVDSGVIADLYGRKGGVDVVPNGVDVESYQVAGAPSVEEDWSSYPVTLVYPGTFSYFPNEDAARRLIEEILPALRARDPAARLILVGREPTAAMREAARRDPAITVTGAVESVAPHLAERCVVALPIAVGSGTRLKVVEAFAASRPVVSTAKGAEGIEGEDGRHLLVRETPRDFAEAVLALWKDARLRSRLCGAALDLVRSRYSCGYAAGLIRRSVEAAGRKEGT